MRNTSTDNTAQKEGTTDQKHKLTNVELSELYPKPKTYEDRLQDQNDREVRRIKRQPRHLTLSVATRLFAIVAIGALILTYVLVLAAWFFNLVLCVLALLLVIKWQTSEISSAMYSKGLNDTTFLTLYFTTLAPLTAAGLYYANAQASTLIILAMYAIIFIAHFVGVHLLLRFIFRVR